MSAPKKSTAPADKLALYEKLIATHPQIERRGAANPYTSLNGHMFTLWANRERWPSGFLKTNENSS